VSHPLTRGDVDLALLQAELAERIGRPVVLTATWPGQVDEDGQPIPGVLVVRDPDTGGDVDVDGRTVRAAIDTHEPALADGGAAEHLAAAEAAESDADRIAALTAALRCLIDR
jgi:hypothetical protein